MARSAPQPGIPFERLLQERSQYVQWLARLDSTDDTTPEAVREKIRADYQTRLDAVVEQLREHASGISDQLIRKREQQAEFGLQERQAQEAMAEAEVRHAVGEYDEAEWQKVRGENHRALVSARESLQRVTDQITQLLEVQQLLGGGPAPRTRAPGPITPVQVPAARPAVREEPADRTGVKPRDAAPAARTVWLPNTKGDAAPPPGDELSFLRSVTDEGAGPASPEGGGGAGAGDAIAPSGSPPAEAAEGAEVRTLKCKECGTMNRPTEWYCERCGGELAAL